MQVSWRPMDGGRGAGHVVLLVVLSALLAGALVLAGCQGTTPEEVTPEVETEADEEAPEAEGPHAPEMNTDEAQQAFEEKSALFLDARPPEDYAKGHLPGALNLFDETFEEHYLLLEDEIKSANTIIAYCDGIECGRAPAIADRLLEMVEVPVFVYKQGYPGWTEAGLPTKTGAKP